MDYFGDVSGHLKGLLNGDCDICVAAVVGGDRISAQQCPKKAVRKIDNLEEAHWHDMFPTQKRRFFECLNDNEHLSFGYVKIRRENLHSMENYHLLYEDVDLPPAWDLALTGYAYGEILFEMGAHEDHQRSTFTVDRMASVPQTEDMIGHVGDFVSRLTVDHDSSHAQPGIQAADCLAGGVAEQLRGGENYMDIIDEEDLHRPTHASLVQLENALHEYEAAP